MVEMCPNNWFFGLFCEFFCLRPLTRYELHSKILLNERPYKKYICRKFHQYSICSYEIKNFQSFLHWFNIHEMASFLDHGEILTRDSPIKQTHSLKTFSKFSNLAQMERKENLRFLSILVPNSLLHIGTQTYF